VCHQSDLTQATIDFASRLSHEETRSHDSCELHMSKLEMGRMTHQTNVHIAFGNMYDHALSQSYGSLTLGIR
jgi:hypothetical protein